MIYVIGITLTNGGYLPEHIRDLLTTKADGSDQTWWTRQQLVDWIDGTDGTGVRGTAFVRNPFGVSDVQVRTVHPTYGAPYVRTAPDDTTADNLLRLPVYSY
jgi:hypothetical protein